MSTDISVQSSYKVNIHLDKVMCLHFPLCGVSACVPSFIWEVITNLPAFPYSKYWIYYSNLCNVNAYNGLWRTVSYICEKLDIIYNGDIYSQVTCINTVKQLNMLGLFNIKMGKMEITMHELVTAEPDWNVTLVPLIIPKAHSWNGSEKNGLQMWQQKPRDEIKDNRNSHNTQYWVPTIKQTDQQF